MKAICLAALLPLLLLVGCAPYVDGYYFSPRPAMAAVPATQPSQPPPVVAFVSIVGIRRQDDQLHIPLSVEARLRLDNNGPEPIAFDPRSMDLITGDLVQFPPPVLEAPPELSVAPGESVIVTANFPFPYGRSYDQFDLASLQLRWTERIGGQNVVQVAQFRREVYVYPYDYYGPYWDEYPGVYVGGAVIIRRR